MKILHFIINDNDILRNLCGALNENLKYISEKLDVKLYVRGNIIIAKGSLSSINKAFKTLKDYVKSLTTSETIQEDIDFLKKYENL